MRASPPDHTAAYFALIGALGGALIAGLLGYVQHRVQRTGERERLEAQLQHERSMVDRAYLRHLIEDAAAQVETTLEALFQVSAKTSVLEGSNDEAGLAAVRAADTTLGNEIGKLYALERRLGLWIPRESGIRVGLDRASSGLRAAQLALRDAPPHDDVKQRYEAEKSKAAEGQAAFAVAGRQSVGLHD